jgi:hypothetical protein
LKLEYQAKIKAAVDEWKEGMFACSILLSFADCLEKLLVTEAINQKKLEEIDSVYKEKLATLNGV